MSGCGLNIRRRMRFNTK